MGRSAPELMISFYPAILRDSSVARPRCHMERDLQWQTKRCLFFLLPLLLTTTMADKSQKYKHRVDLNGAGSEKFIVKS